MPTTSYDEFLLEQLRDPETAAEYLSAALEEGTTPEFLIALRQVTEARGGVGSLAEETKLNRQSLYRMLSGEGNPTLSSLRTVLRALGIDVSFRPIGEAAA